MFPINFNFPYRKKDGSLITMEKALDGAGADLDLIDLDDVAIQTPTDNEGLVYDGTTQKWKNEPVVTGDLWVENGAHNYLPNELTTQVINGLTVTVNEDKSVTVNGTTSAGTQLTLMSQTYEAFPEKDFILSNGGYTNNDAFVFIERKKGADGNPVVDVHTKTGEMGFTVDYSIYDYYTVGIWVASGTSLSNVTFKPMIRLASDPSTEYAPHAMTNRELTDGRIKYKDITLENPSADTAYGGMYEFDYRMNLSGHIVLSANIIDYSGLSKMVMLSAGSDDILRIFSATNGSIATSLDIRIAYI